MIPTPTTCAPVLRVGARPDFEGLAGPCEGRGIARFEWVLEGGGVRPRWLAACGMYPRFFWSPGGSDRQVLACGAAAVGALGEMLAVLGESDEGVGVAGGGRFDAGAAIGSEWEGFGESMFFIPRAEVVSAGGEVRFALNLRRGDDPGMAARWVEAMGGGGVVPRPLVLTRCDTPDFQTWSDMVGRVLAGCAGGRFEKVVLARRSLLELGGEACPWDLAERLMVGAPGCHCFGLEVSGRSGAFVGASPELLYRRRGRRIESEAVAGTRLRSLDCVEDQRLGSQLLGFSKERLEQEIVARAIGGAFESVCDEYMREPSPGVLKLARLQHLRTGFEGLLRRGVDDAAVLREFHPTPATCGLGRREAMEFIASHEGFDRGWYAGPVGLVRNGRAEFTVAIRSLLLKGARAHVYAGAGIVSGSDAEREWSELEDKVAGSLQALGA
jgi:menaquinone-specific isochorismate synthase